MRAILPALTWLFLGELLLSSAPVRFTRTLLEQATDERIAQYKAGRFPRGVPVADLCCGIGGDLLALALRGPALAVDRDPAAVLLAEANARLYGAESLEAVAGDVSHLSLDQTPLWHIDPDRRAAGSRATRLELFSPDPPVLERLLRTATGAAIKLAPATITSEEWMEAAEREWIGSGGECRQQVAWFGSLAERPGRSAATIVDTPSGAPRTVVGSDDVASPPVAAYLGLFLYEPHAAVLAAGLDHWLANEHALASVAPRTAYWTGDERIRDEALACFQVMEVLPLDERQLRGALRQRRIGRLEIKKRGVAVEPERLRARLKLDGDESATLILYRGAGGSSAVLAQRLSDQAG